MDQLVTAGQRDAWEAVKRINAAWREGQPERLAELFHERMAIVGPDGQRYAEGRDACVESYRTFCEQATVTGYNELDPIVDVYNHVAVVSYGFDIDYTLDGKAARESGQDFFVLERDGDGWLAVWRQLSSSPG
jgi:ketosteroid isomerase-like protein